MDSRNEENKSRFEISKLEARIAPGNACAGLLNALAHASPHVAPEQVEFVVNNILARNPQAADC